MNELPYVLLSDTRRHALAQRIGMWIARWRQTWAGEEAPQCIVDIPEEGISASGSGWQDGVCFQAGSAPQPYLAMLIPMRGLPTIVGMATERTGAWVRPVETDSLAAQWELDALLALTEVIPRTMGFESFALERTALSVADTLQQLTARRYIAARIALGGAKSTFGMLLSPAFASALLPARQPTFLPESVERRAAAVGAESVTIDAVLGHAEVSLQDLAALAVGEVIVLDEKLNAPSQVLIRGGAHVAVAALGRLEGRRALKVESPVKQQRS